MASPRIIARESDMWKSTAHFLKKKEKKKKENQRPTSFTRESYVRLDAHLTWPNALRSNRVTFSSVNWDFKMQKTWMGIYVFPLHLSEPRGKEGREWERECSEKHKEAEALKEEVSNR
jgi:hypothetical protein